MTDVRLRERAAEALGWGAALRPLHDSDAQDRRCSQTSDGDKSNAYTFVLRSLGFVSGFFGGMMKLIGLVLIAAVAVLVALPGTMPRFTQAFTNVQALLVQSQDSFSNVSHTKIAPARWSMLGVVSVLIFFRLRRKHQVTFSSTRLTHDQRWAALRTTQPATSLSGHYPADGRLNTALSQADMGDASEEDVAASLAA